MTDDTTPSTSGTLEASEKALLQEKQRQDLLQNKIERKKRMTDDKDAGDWALL